MSKEKQNPAGGPGFAKKVVSDDKSIVPSPAENGNDNSASAQRFRLLAALSKSSVTTLEARRFLDVLHPAARVMELRRMGFEIVTVWTIDVTSEGREHRVARYLLRG